jgi:hypothetical protein
VAHELAPIWCILLGLTIDRGGYEKNSILPHHFGGSGPGAWGGYRRGNRSGTIPWSGIGARAGADHNGDGLGIVSSGLARICGPCFNHWMARPRPNIWWFLFRAPSRGWNDEKRSGAGSPG